jgi:hypothetical protein
MWTIRRSVKKKIPENDSQGKAVSNKYMLHNVYLILIYLHTCTHSVNISKSVVIPRAVLAGECDVYSCQPGR